MPWSKELQESYEHQQKIRYHMIDCMVCQCPITPTEQKKNEGMCNFCYEDHKGDVKE